jgi:RNA polymerase sigma factor (sigma-70 family)
MSADEVKQLRPVPWLLTITRNTAYNHHRSTSRRPQTVGELSTIGVPLLSIDPTPDVTALRAESARELDRALQQLSPPQREAVVLRHVLDLSSRDVAEVMGIPENTVKSHVARGLQVLRDGLNSGSES